MATRYVVLFVLKLVFAYSYGGQGKAVRSPWNIQAITYGARPEEILGGNFQADSCLPDASICMLSSATKLNKLTVSVVPLSELVTQKDALIKDGGYELKDEPGLGEGAFTATKRGGEIIEIGAPKGKKAVAVRFVYTKNLGMRALRDFTARILSKL